jgi:polyvinyl alcohol dehydrogenase (cytochrome)
MVGTLAVKWSFPPFGAPPVGPFRASPIVVNDMVFIGSQDGYFYALDAATGKLTWQYPQPPAPPLLSGDPMWRYGIQSSASYSFPNHAVIFGAQDPSLGRYGNARLFALDAKTGAVLWNSDPIAEITGDNSCGTTELHQRIGYSTPLITANRAYVGIESFENPVQTGRVIAVDTATGHIDSTFQFRSAGTSASPPGTALGGGVWNAPASDGPGIYFTTGNTAHDACAPRPEPNPNHGLSMIRVDPSTGNIIWAFQPVPFALDFDPDWAAGAAVMWVGHGCGELVLSVQKDGWTWAVDQGGPNPLTRWAFPTGPWYANNGFKPGDGTVHPDPGPRVPGAAWGSVLVITTGARA